MPEKQRCECGCEQFEHLNRMSFVRAITHRRTAEKDESAPVKTWMVRDECEEGFKRELELITAQDRFIDLMLAVHWLRRVVHFWALRSAQKAILLRTKPKEADELASRFAWLIVSPDWLSERLSKRWAKRRPSANEIIETEAKII